MVVYLHFTYEETEAAKINMTADEDTSLSGSRSVEGSRSSGEEH
jgi:hypothetical protein